MAKIDQEGLEKLRHVRNALNAMFDKLDAAGAFDSVQQEFQYIRGGAALSMKFTTNVPIKFMGTGEKIEQLDVFHPDRIANRILGMGDVVSLVEKASQDLDEEKIKKTVDLTGIILTRVDGDGRGGAALSMKFSTNTPIKFMGVGEKIEQLDVFHPDRIANRILGMGDVVSLVEKAAQDLDEEKIKKTEENLKSGSFSMEDYLSQLRQMKKMGGMEGVLSMLPGVSKIKKQMDNANIDENIIKTNEAIILSMTKEERINPKIINGARKKRISSGSGVDTATVNKLLKQFKMMTNMMKKMSKGDQKAGIPPEIFNQLK